MTLHPSTLHLPPSTFHLPPNVVGGNRMKAPMKGWAALLSPDRITDGKLLVLALVLTACGSPNAKDDQSGWDASARSDSAASPTGATVLRQSAQSRVLIRHSPSENHVVWEMRAGPGWQQRWQSLNIYGAQPEVLLLDANGDGEEDLFWSFGFEELVGGMLVLASTPPIELYPDDDECLQPEMKQSNGRAVFVIRAPSVFSADDCSDPIVRTCVLELEMDWPRHYVIEGRRLQASTQPAASIALRFRAAAQKLDSLLAAKAVMPGRGVSYEACGATTPSLSFPTSMIQVFSRA